MASCKGPIDIEAKLVSTGSSMESDNKPRIDMPVGKQLVSETLPGSTSAKKAESASENQTEISASNDSQSKSNPKRKTSESSYDPGMIKLLLSLSLSLSFSLSLLHFFLANGY